MAIKQVKPGLYMVTGFGGNSTVRVTDQGVILVDTKNLGDGPFNDLVAQIKTVTNQPVKHVFITHVHQDHSGNIGRFIKAGAEVIAHEGLKRNLETGGLDGKGYTAPAGKPDPPNVTYTTSREVKLGNGIARAHHFANAHTGGDTVVHFPDLRVIAFGDEFVNQPPNADIPNGGSVLTFPTALAEALKLDWDTAIPGHGNDPMTRADVQAYQKKVGRDRQEGAGAAQEGCGEGADPPADSGRAARNCSMDDDRHRQRHAPRRLLRRADQRGEVGRAFRWPPADRFLRSELCWRG